MRLIIIGIALIPLFFQLSNPTVENESEYMRAKLIDELSNDFMGANCFCRLGDERGYEVNEYLNSYHDFGSLKYWKSPTVVNENKRGICASLCKEKAIEWLARKSNDYLCNLANKTSPFHLVAYSKVGTKKWRRSHTIRDIPCTSASANYVDPCSLPSPDKYLNFDLQVMRNGGTEFRAHATPKCKVPAGWGYHWRVCEFNTTTNECVPNTELSMPEHWWTFNHACSFNGYNGTQNSGNPQTAGVFKRAKKYRIIFGVYGSGQEWVEIKKYFNQYGFIEI